MKYTDEYLDAILAKKVGDEWTAEERKALPAAAKRLDEVRAKEAANYEDLQRMREGKGAVISTPTDYFKFRSMSLPKNYQYHREAGGTFGPDGECEFHSRAEVERTIDRANDAGEAIVYPGRGGVNRYAN